MAEKNKKMEQIFDDIVPYEDYEQQQEDNNHGTNMTKNKKDPNESQKHLMERLSSMEKVELALEKVGELDEMDEELDSISTEALQSYSELFERAGTFADSHAGKIYEVSAQLLKIALDAKDSKLDRKLRTIEMQLKKAKLESDSKKNQGDDDGDKGLTEGQVMDALAEIKSSINPDDFNIDRDNAPGGGAEESKNGENTK